MENVIEINVNGPEYRGAPYPKYDPFEINESKFNDEERLKFGDITMTKDGKTGNVYWMAQEVWDGHGPSEAWIKEVKRAFKKNGAKKNCVISVKFCGRDWSNDYDPVELKLKI